MNKTSIEWTDFSSNLIKYRDPEGRTVHGCIKVSAGCANCYASAISKRFSGGEFTASRQKTLTPYFDEAEAQRILRTRVTGKRIFIGDMTDVFGEWVPSWLIRPMFDVFAERPDLIFQVLTKRPERIREEVPNPPLPNVWLGTSVENQAAAEKRIPELLSTPAEVRFLSCEPLIEEVEFTNSLLWVPKPCAGGCGCQYPEDADRYDCACSDECCYSTEFYDRPPDISWVIVGGESGPGARPCDLAWIRGIVRQCKAAGTAVFVKQLGSKPIEAVPRAPGSLGRLVRHGDLIRTEDGRTGVIQADLSCKPPFLEGRGTAYRPMRLRDRAGREMSEWPEDLRVRQYPS